MQDRRSMLRIAAVIAASAPVLALPEAAAASAGLHKYDNPQALEAANVFVQQYESDSSISAEYDKLFDATANRLSQDRLERPSPGIVDRQVDGNVL